MKYCLFGCAYFKTQPEAVLFLTLHDISENSWEFIEIVLRMFKEFKFNNINNRLIQWYSYEELWLNIKLNIMEAPVHPVSK